MLIIDYPFDDAQDRFTIDYTRLRGHMFRLPRRLLYKGGENAFI